MRKIVFLLLSWLTIPHILFYLLSKNKKVLDKDIDRWAQCLNVKESVIRGGKNRLLNLAYILLFNKEFRNVFYLRIGHLKFFLYYLPPLSTLYICTKSENFGAGTFIQHGFATVITAERIGENCWINQQVTIGFNDSRKYGYGKPTIGNNVRVSAGAKVCGKIKVGDGSTIGVNAVVVKDVPEKSVVVPSPMMLIMENGNSVYKKF
jgi:serine O-acetyltransferase